MTHRPFRYPLELRLRASRRLQCLLAAIHAIAALAFLYASIDPAALAAVLSLVAASAVLAWHRERAKGGRTLVLDDDGSLGVAGPNGIESAHVLPGCTDFGWAIWLQWRFADEGRPERPGSGAIMLLPDHLPQECWRPLRAWLRHKAAVRLERQCRS